MIGCLKHTIGLAKNLFSFFSYNGSSSAWLSLTLFRTILLDCTVTAVISACVKKKPIKIGNFLCSYLNIKDERRQATFSAYYALLFQER